MSNTPLADSIMIRSDLQFWGRGFSKRTRKILLEHIDAPERLLFVTEQEIRRLPGIGKVSLDEIMRYRSRFIPDEGTP